MKGKKIKVYQMPTDGVIALRTHKEERTKYFWCHFVSLEHGEGSQEAVTSVFEGIKAT